MLYENVELHNVAEIEKLDDGAVALQRVPNDVRKELNPAAQERVSQPGCGEIRFVCEGDGSAGVTLSSAGANTQVVPFFGLFRHGAPFVVGSEPETFEFAMPENLRAALPRLERRQMPFSPRVCRLMMRGDRACFHGVEGNGVRPPSGEELPWLRYLSYGTSITHGGAATWPHLAYVAQVARRIGADLINLGVGGSCHAEAAFADYIAERDDWDIATLALSVNMMDFSAEEFRRRIRYMVDTVSGANADRPVACITLYRYFGDGWLQADTSTAKSDEFRQILREAVWDCPCANVHLLEGREMLTDLGGLTTDIIHPADDGMIQMGENIARRLKPLICRMRRD